MEEGPAPGREEVLLGLSRFTDKEHLGRLAKITDVGLLGWLLEVAELVQPSLIYVNTGSPEDLDYVRRKAIEGKEELPTKYRFKTVHFDGVYDLGRDLKNTRILVPAGVSYPLINTLEREKGLTEIKELMKGVMKGRTMFVSFYCFGPRGSPLTSYGVQVTDSAYVVHSENILYRPCYDAFTSDRPPRNYMRFLHATGERNELGWSKNYEMKRIYIDPEDNITYSVNTQYAGNTVGLKKLALRLCVNQGAKEGHLCEHMFIAGIRGPGGRVTYVTGAFPAGTGKTSTAMVADLLVSDDLAIVYASKGAARAINPEVGSFGIIDGVNPEDDKEIYDILLDPETEVIFSNILLTDDGEPWWRGRPEPPRPGMNYAGRWPPEGADADNEQPSHPNARFTTYLRYFKNLDPRIDDPDGVPVEAMIFGGRDSDTNVPVEEAFNWVHGNVTKAASLESERTAAVIGKVGEKVLNPYAILDFLPFSPGRFLQLHIEFGRRLTKELRVYSVNYFLRDAQGRFLAPTGYIPLYEDLVKLFDSVLGKEYREEAYREQFKIRVTKQLERLERVVSLYEDLVKLFDSVLGKEYREEAYREQFKIRVTKQLERLERVLSVYREIYDTPREFFDVMEWQKRRLEEAKAKYGDYIDPFTLNK